MTLPTGTITAGNVNNELGQGYGAYRSWYNINQNVKPGYRSGGGYQSTNQIRGWAYYQRNVDSNCNNGNCSVNCNCACDFCQTNCVNCYAVNCANCDDRPWIQPNCNCACTYNCNVYAVNYNCNCCCNCNCG